MPIIRLPDGSQRQFDAPVTVADVAMNIGAGLAKAALAGKVNDKIVGTLGVIGPTRMAYERVIPIVDITAKLLSSALSQQNA